MSPTVNPAHSQAFTNSQKILTESAGPIEVKEQENINSPLKAGRSGIRLIHIIYRMNFNINVRIYNLYDEKALTGIFLLTSVTKVRFMRKLDTQTMRTKISRLVGTRNNFGNKSLTVVIKLSTITNWRQKE